MRSGRVVRNAPYSADVITESTQILADGNRVRQSLRAKIYRDSAGRTRREQSVNLDDLSPNSKMPRLVFISDPVAQVNFALNANDHTGTRSVRNAWNHGPQGMRARDGAGLAPRRTEPGAGRKVEDRKVEDLGRQTMEGLSVQGRRTTITLPSGETGNGAPLHMTSETWYAADLQINLLTKRSDPRHGETVTHLVNLVRAEPAHSLFEVPSDYKLSDAVPK
jgi:hypothetical protein